MEGVGEAFRQVPIFDSIGKLFGAESKEEKDVREAFERMRQEVDTYRPYAAGARMQGLENQLAMFGPINQMLSQMYGPSATFDTSALLQNPMANIPTISPADQKLQELRQRHGGDNRLDMDEYDRGKLVGPNGERLGNRGRERTSFSF